MTAPLVCPRCSAEVSPPGLSTADYQCPVHGSVVALAPATSAEPSKIRQIAARATVPLWMVWPLPEGWLATGIRWCRRGDQKVVGVATSVTGRGVSFGPSDLVVIAEEPGVGLGARYAGLDTPDPGDRISRLPADTKIHIAGHPTALWNVPVEDDHAVYVGEAEGCWLWLIGWPELAWAGIHDDLRLVDVRASDWSVDLPLGALSPRLSQ